MARDDGYTRYTLRIPTPLYERIKDAAGEKSINAEILEALEEAYPPRSIDAALLSTFLSSLVEVTKIEGHEDYLDIVNQTLANTKRPWTVKAVGDGEIRFYPYASHPKEAIRPIDDNSRTSAQRKPRVRTRDKDQRD